MNLPALVEARLIRRYKRFLCDVELAGGDIVTAYCPNPGSMLGLTEPGSRVFLVDHRGTGRKLAYAWMLAEVALPGQGKELVGIDTSLPNGIAAEAIAAGVIPTLAGYARLRREVRYGRNSRIDILLEGPGRPACWVEVKNVHLMRQPGLAEFPDSVTARGAKHLGELADRVQAGDRAVMLYVIQMPARAFDLARDIDPKYAQAFKLVQTAGVEALAWSCRITRQAISLDCAVPISRAG